MKKVSIFAGLLLCGSVAMAQNNVSTTIQGTTNRAGNDNTATIGQTGSANISYLTQTSDNDFTLTQSGNDNSSRMTQGLFGNNTASVNQTGDYNKLARRANGGGAALQGTGNTLNVDQVGDYNIAGVYQDAKNHTVDIFQTGDRNVAEAKQDAGTAGSLIVIDQTGSDNKSFANQQKPTGYNTSEATISGDDNWTKTYQESGSSAYITVTGTGNGNTGVGAVGSDYLDISQVGGANYAELDILGDYNGVMVDQDGGSTADLEITGSYNTMDIMQTGSGHSSTETINGSNNTITVNQN